MTKTCSKCGLERPVVDFHADRRSTDGKRSACRECALAYNRAWNKANRDSVNTATSAWRARNPEKVRAQKRQWRQANPDRVRAHKRADHERHRQRIIARVARWRIANPERRRAQSILRRSRLANAAGCAYTTVQHLLWRIELYGGKCRYCGADADSLDHRIPLARGGSHLPANLVPACRSCNSRKNVKTEPEFLLAIGRG